MHLRATAQAMALGLGGLALLIAGVALEATPLVVWGSGLCLGVGLGRALTELRIGKVRQAGFEMSWLQPERALRVARGEPLVLQAEIRNRAAHAVRCTGLRALSDSNLTIALTPQTVEIPPLHSLTVDLRIETPRVGRHGIHGLMLEAQSGPQLFSVPLTFANPLGIEVLPTVYRRRARAALGGRSRRDNPQGNPRRRRGESGEFSEIRDHQIGDPFKRIAWRASARRGKLLVRDYELQEHDVVWLVLDASVELWAGPAGHAPLDIAIDELASLADHHLANGDSVGLVIAGARVLCRIPPASGAGTLAQILEALAFATQTSESDRSGLDEQEAASWVIEHLRMIEPGLVTPQPALTIERLTQVAATVLGRAPLPVPNLQTGTARERTLRQYLAAFGIGSPARLQQDRPQTDATISEVLAEIARARPRATRVVLCSPTPDAASLGTLHAALARLPRQHVRLTWLPAPHEPALAALRASAGPSALTVDGVNAEALQSVTDAVRLRMRVLDRQGERALRVLGIKLQRGVRPSTHASASHD